MRQRSVAWAIAAFLAAGCLAPLAAEARDGVALFEHGGFDGDSREIGGDIADLGVLDFHDRASSMRVYGGTWLLCEHTNYRGRCVVVDGDVSDFGRLGLNDKVSSIRRTERRERSGIVLFKDVNFSGRKKTLDRDVADLRAVDFNDKASSVRVKSGSWLLCEHADFEGRCVAVEGDVANFGDLGLNDKVSSVRRLRNRDRDRRRDEGGYGGTGRERGSIVLFKGDHFSGRSATLERDVSNLQEIDFNDNVSSVRVEGGSWRMCEHAGFQGRCITVDGDVPMLAGFGLDNRISSIRRVR